MDRLLEAHPKLRCALQRSHELITERRNTLDHCWVGRPRKLKRNALSEYVQAHHEAAQRLEEAIEQLEQLEPVPSPHSPYFLNLTNHPQETWSESQRGAALEMAPRIVDMPFPSVDPRLSTAEVERRATEIVDEIEPGCTHALVMGELTFTVALVRRMQALGIDCLATTGPRLVETREDGSRISRFQFTAFRPYPTLS